MTSPSHTIDEICVNTIRTLSIDAIQKANSGHPGLPLGAAAMAYVLWQKHLVHNPANPAWPDRDRFVLSAGHGSMLLYSLLHLTGYGVSLEDIKQFRQLGSLTPGHPEFHHTPGVEATTGPLGQGAANAVGMALAERILASRYNRPGYQVVDHYTFALVSDGDLMEGIAAEAASFAGHQGLGKLIYLYDSNGVTLDGPSSWLFGEAEIGARYAACGWQVLTVEQGDTDLAAISEAIAEAKADTSRPSLVIVKTTIGYGSPAKAGTSASHGSPLGVAEVEATKQNLDWEAPGPFFVPEDARAHFARALDNGQRHESHWRATFDAWRREYPDLAHEWDLAMAGQLPLGWDGDLPVWGPESTLATRKSGGKAMNAIAAKVPWLIGGDADLSCSTGTAIAGADWLDREKTGRNIHYGIREHAMAAIANGLAYHGGVRPFVSTFFVFCDYLRPALRMAALNRLPVIYAFTHDSVAVGEDGPTHQPVEHLMSLRVMPGLSVIRPCDANETREAWKQAMKNAGPTVLVLSRQDLPTLNRAALAPAEMLARGGYILKSAAKPAAVLMATGSEVHVALKAAALLEKDGIAVNVVSLPCFNLFEAQDEAYRREVLPPALPKVSVEAGVTLGWERYTESRGASVGIDRFGLSAPGDTVMADMGITPEAVANKIKHII